MRNKQNEKVLVVRITQIDNLRKGNTSFVSLKSAIFKKGYSVVYTCMNLMINAVAMWKKLRPYAKKGKPVIWKIMQRWSCAVLIINVRSGMRDMIWYKRLLIVTNRGNLCIWKERRLFCTIVTTMILYIKVINVKIAIVQIKT